MTGLFRFGFVQLVACCAGGGVVALAALGLPAAPNAMAGEGGGV